MISSQYSREEKLLVPIERIETKKIAEVVREKIEDMIKRGEIQPGDKLDSVVALSEQFDVSRSAVREALSALRAVGIITIRQGEGTFVNQYDASTITEMMNSPSLLSTQTMKELFEVRHVLEKGAAELAALRRTDSHLEQMRVALEQMTQASNGSGDLGEQGDVRFHLAIAEASGNHLLQQMMSRLSDTLQKTMYETRKVWLFFEQRSFQHLIDEHQQILHAIEDHQAQAAIEAMSRHLINVEDVLSKGTKHRNE
jgi:GntR family transcriptional repressor for pyruvate dehydrogenase complex